MRNLKFIMALTAALLLPSAQGWAQKSGPVIMILINEKNMGTYSMGDSERVIAEYLMAREVNVVDSDMIKTKVNRDKALQASSGSPRAAAALGLQFGADVIIVGKAIAKGSPDRVKDTSFRSYSASVSLKAVATDTAKIISADNASAAKIHVDDIAGGSLAIQEATRQVVARLMPDVLSKFGSSAGKIQTVQLVIGDVSQVWQVAAIKKLLRENIRGVKDVVQRGFVSGIAMFDVIWNGNSQGLAEELTMADTDYFRIKVVSVSSGKVDTKLVEKRR